MKISTNSNTDFNKYKNLESNNDIKFSKNNLGDVNRIFYNKYKAFEALENLILNDNEKNKETKIHRYKSITNDNINRDRNKTPGKFVKTEIISIPKLDFTRIYKKYISTKLLIKKKQ